SHLSLSTWTAPPPTHIYTLSLHDALPIFETPLSAYLKLANGPYTYLLESVQGGETWGRYSIIGLGSRTVLTVRNDVVTVRDNGRSEEHTSELQSRENLVCRLLLEKKKTSV